MVFAVAHRATERSLRLKLTRLIRKPGADSTEILDAVCVSGSTTFSQDLLAWERPPTEGGMGVHMPTRVSAPVGFEGGAAGKSLSDPNGCWVREQSA